MKLQNPKFYHPIPSGSKDTGDQSLCIFNQNWQFATLISAICNQIFVYNLTCVVAIGEILYLQVIDGKEFKKSNHKSLKATEVCQICLLNDKLSLTHYLSFECRIFDVAAQLRYLKFAKSFRCVQCVFCQKTDLTWNYPSQYWLCVRKYRLVNISLGINGFIRTVCVHAHMPVCV